MQETFQQGVAMQPSILLEKLRPSSTPDSIQEMIRQHDHMQAAREAARNEAQDLRKRKAQSQNQAKQAKSKRETNTHSCSKCNKHKTRDHFADSQWNNKKHVDANGHLRKSVCLECSPTCKTHNRSECRKCVTYKCSNCSSDKTSEGFSRSQMRHRSKQRRLTCLECRPPVKRKQQ